MSPVPKGPAIGRNLLVGRSRRRPQPRLRPRGLFLRFLGRGLPDRFDVALAGPVLPAPALADRLADPGRPEVALGSAPLRARGSEPADDRFEDGGVSPLAAP